MSETAAPLLYFLDHPHISFWLLDLTALLLGATLVVTLRQLFITKRQLQILVRQDEINRELLSRRARLAMYTNSEPPGQLVVSCRNEGNKTAQNFYWHLLVPITVSRYGVWSGAGKEILSNSGMETRDESLYRRYGGFVQDPLYPSRSVILSRIATSDLSIPLWWSTISEDGAEPNADGEMQRIDSNIR